MEPKCKNIDYVKHLDLLVVRIQWREDTDCAFVHLKEEVYTMEPRTSRNLNRFDHIHTSLSEQTSECHSGSVLKSIL